MSDPLVLLEAVDFAYSSQRVVLQNCHLRLERSARVGLTGPIGCGKTTLIELIVGLRHPTAGRLEVFGKQRIREEDFHEVRRRVGLLFQDSDDQLFCPTVAEDVAFGPLNLGKSREQVAHIVPDTLQQLGLSGYEQRITHQLSGGEKRLVALAAVLAMQPEVLLLDEPTTGLDATAAERVINILNNLPQTMLIVSHDSIQLKKLATEFLHLADRQLVPIDASSLP